MRQVLSLDVCWSDVGIRATRPEGQYNIYTYIFVYNIHVYIYIHIPPLSPPRRCLAHSGLRKPYDHLAFLKCDLHETQKAPECNIMQGGRWCFELWKLNYGAARERQNRHKKATTSSEVGKANESEGKEVRTGRKEG